MKASLAARGPRMGAAPRAARKEQAAEGQHQAFVTSDGDHNHLQK